ncbi:MAG: 50S ribosomal protein L11 methyltransferase [Firmicutes bacterium]|nr:50S ribosomal protein L11 methyltransferase [Bacillota bacterium]
MKYIEYTIYPPAGKVSEVSDMLTALGQEELIINDPDEAEAFFSKDGGYKWNYVDQRMLEALRSGAYIKFYLPEGEKLSDEIFSYVKDFDYSLALTDDEDWLHKWEEYYVPFYIADSIVIKPVWRDYEAKAGDIVIEIDPGLAFGTGSSPTTYLATRLLKKYMKAGDRLLDIGCGTGIQSLVGAKLGASDILAVDLDPEAVRSTAANAGLNGEESLISVRKNDLANGLDYVADTIVANLTGPLVLELCKDVRKNIKKGGILVASGIIDDMEDACKEKLESIGFRCIEILRDDCWSAIAAVKE